MSPKSGKKSLTPGGRKTRSKRGKVMQPKTQVVVPAAFQSSLARSMLSDPEANSVIQLINRSGGGNVGSQKEVYMTVTDYFDVGKNNGTPPAVEVLPYFQWCYKPEQDLFFSNFPGYKSYTKLLEASIYCLPRFDLDTSIGAVMFVTSVPVTATGGSKLAANPCSTLITPTTNATWRRIGHYKASQLFGDATVFPLGTTGEGQVVFSGVIVDPDTMGAITTKAVPTQIKVVLKVAVPLPGLSTFNFGVTLSDQSNTMYQAIGQAPGGQMAQCEITGMGNVA